MSVIKHETGKAAKTNEELVAVVENATESVYEQWPQEFFDGFAMMKNAIKKPTLAGPGESVPESVDAQIERERLELEALSL